LHLLFACGINVSNSCFNLMVEIGDFQPQCQRYPYTCSNSWFACNADFTKFYNHLVGNKGTLYGYLTIKWDLKSQLVVDNHLVGKKGTLYGCLTIKWDLKSQLVVVPNQLIPWNLTTAQTFKLQHNNPCNVVLYPVHHKS
jgi:hypothetical protein